MELTQPRLLDGARWTHHGGLFYATDAERRAVVSAFVAQALEQQEQVVLCGVEPVTDAPPGQVELWLLPAAASRLADLAGEAARAVTRGWAGLRVVIEMTTLAPQDWETFLARLSPRAPVQCLCLYDRRQIRPGDLLGAMAAHPLLWVDGEPHANPYYVPSTGVLDDADATALLEQRLASVRQHTGVLASLHVQQENFHLLVEAVTDYAIYMLDPEGRIISWNAGAARLKGYEAAEIIGKSADTFYTPEDRAAGRFRRALLMARETGRYQDVGWRVRKNGSRFWAYVVVTAVRDAHGQPIGFAKVTRDMTAQMQQEEALRKSRAMFESLFEAAPDSIVLVDGEGRIVRLNRQTELLFGYAREDLLGHPIERLLREDWRSPYSAYRRHYYAQPLPTPVTVDMDLVCQRQNGTHFPVTVRLNPLQTEEGIRVITTFHDMTEWQAMGQALKQANAEMEQRVQERTAELAASVAQLQAVMHSMTEGLIIVDLQGDVRSFNSAARRIHGFAEDDDLNMPRSALAPRFTIFDTQGHPLPSEAWPITRALRGEFFADLEVQVHRKVQGDTRIVSYSGGPVRDARGQPILALVMARDVTAQKEAERERERLVQQLQVQNEQLHQLTGQLEAERARLDAVLQQMPIGVIIMDAQTRETLLYNEQSAYQLGFASVAEARQVQPGEMQVLYPDGRPYDLEDLPQFRALRTGQPVLNEEMDVVRLQGERRTLSVSAAPVGDSDGSIRWIVITFHDITHRKAMEEALRRAHDELEQRVRERTAELVELQRELENSREKERLHLAQELHDGPMQDLYGIGFQLMGLAEALPEEDRKVLVAVQTTTEEVIGLLRAISQELRPPTLAPFGLEVAIRSHTERFQESHPELALHLDLAADGQRLPESTRLALFRIYQQALTNVVQHAAARHVWVRLELEAARLTLTVRDDGRGFAMPRRLIQLARQGHLGLVGATERAEAVGGTMEVVSAPGEGTTVRVIVPCPQETKERM